MYSLARVDIRRVAAELGILPAVLLRQVEGGPVPVGRAVGARRDALDALLVFVDAPGGKGRLDDLRPPRHVPSRRRHRAKLALAVDDSAEGRAQEEEDGVAVEDHGVVAGFGEGADEK